MKLLRHRLCHSCVAGHLPIAAILAPIDDAAISPIPISCSLRSMRFSRLSRYLVRSACSGSSQVALSGVHSAWDVVSGDILVSTFECDGSGLGFTRGYLTQVGASKADGPEKHPSDLRFLFVEPSFIRFFSSRSSGQKNYNNYRPKDKMETPKDDANNTSNARGPCEQKEISFRQHLKSGNTLYRQRLDPVGLNAGSLSLFWYQEQLTLRSNFRTCCG